MPQFVNVLSFDPAIKKMGVCFLRINMGVKQDLINELATHPITSAESVNNMMTNMNTILNNHMYVHWLDNIDMIPNKPVKSLTHMQLATAVNTTVADLDERCSGHTVHAVLIESQPLGVGGRNAVVCGQLLTHYLNRKKSGWCGQVECISPLWKNRVCVVSNLTYAEFLKRKYSSPYTCNKAHCRENFKAWAKLTGYDLTKNKKHLNDISDAFMQALAWSHITQPTG